LLPFALEQAQRVRVGDPGSPLVDFALVFFLDLEIDRSVRLRDLIGAQPELFLERRPGQALPDQAVGAIVTVEVADRIGPAVPIGGIGSHVLA